MSNQKRVTGEALLARDACWLQLREEGWETADIAEHAGVSLQLVRRRLRLAEAARDERFAAISQPDPCPRPQTPWWLELVPYFPVGPFTPQSECPHRGPMPDGTLLCCMVCDASGVDEHPALKRDPASDPRPEPKPVEPEPEPVIVPRIVPRIVAETRRERRRRKFAGASPC